MPLCKAGDGDLGYWKICPSVTEIKPRGGRQILSTKPRVRLFFSCSVFLMSYLIALSKLSYLGKIVNALHILSEPQKSHFWTMLHHNDIKMHSRLALYRILPEERSDKR